jgi:hypothetical protein
LFDIELLCSGLYGASFFSNDVLAQGDVALQNSTYLGLEPSQAKKESKGGAFAAHRCLF